MIRLITIAAFFVAGCNNQQTTETNTGTTETVHAGAKPTGVIVEKAFILSGCYRLEHPQDRATMELQVQDTLVTGNLVFALHEKDGNKGTLRGVIRDTLIIADYTYESEGMMSVREEIFAIQDSTLVRAYGPVTNQNNKMVFTDKGNLKFEHNMVFRKVGCE
jgi:hypothetical protein